jgi:hypothetical protein
MKKKKPVKYLQGKTETKYTINGECRGTKPIKKLYENNR